MTQSAGRTDIDIKAFDSADVLPSFPGPLFRYRHGTELRLNVTQRIPSRSGEDAEVTYADEVLRQDVHCIPAYELDPAECHLLDLTFIPIVLVVEGNTMGVDTPQALVADGNAVGIPGDILQSLVHTAYGSNAVHHPRFGEASLSDALWDLHRRCESLHILGPEHLAHGLDREEERLLAPFFHELWKVLPLAICIHSATGHDAVQVRCGWKDRLLPHVWSRAVMPMRRDFPSAKALSVPHAAVNNALYASRILPRTKGFSS